MGPSFQPYEQSHAFGGAAASPDRWVYYPQDSSVEKAKLTEVGWVPDGMPSAVAAWEPDQHSHRLQRAEADEEETLATGLATTTAMAGAPRRTLSRFWSLDARRCAYPPAAPIPAEEILHTRQYLSAKMREGRQSSSLLRMIFARRAAQLIFDHMLAAAVRAADAPPVTTPVPPVITAVPPAATSPSLQPAPFNSAIPGHLLMALSLYHAVPPVLPSPQRNGMSGRLPPSPLLGAAAVPPPPPPPQRGSTAAASRASVVSPSGGVWHGHVTPPPPPPRQRGGTARSVAFGGGVRRATAGVDSGTSPATADGTGSSSRRDAYHSTYPRPSFRQGQATPPPPPPPPTGRPALCTAAGGVVTGSTVLPVVWQQHHSSKMVLPPPLANRWATAATKSDRRPHSAPLPPPPPPACASPAAAAASAAAAAAVVTAAAVGVPPTPTPSMPELLAALDAACRAAAAVPDVAELLPCRHSASPAGPAGAHHHQHPPFHRRIPSF